MVFSTNVASWFAFKLAFYSLFWKLALGCGRCRVGPDVKCSPVAVQQACLKVEGLILEVATQQLSHAMACNKFNE